MRASNLNLPNALSTSRILLVPVLLTLAWHHSSVFTPVLAASLLTDLLDGYLARRLGQQTQLGAQLDSWGDLLTVLVYPPAAWWLQRDEIRRNLVYAVIAGVAYCSPILFGFIKFHRLTSYHTRLSALAAFAMGVAMIIFFAGWTDLPFRLACLLLVVSQLEEIAISAVLTRWTSNVRDYRHARGTPTDC
jgi:phosphatidylglycerophosphate synthase